MRKQKLEEEQNLRNKKYHTCLGFGTYLLFGILRLFVGGSCEVGSNWVFNCSWKQSKLLLPPLEGASTMNGDPLMSNASTSNGAGSCSGVEDKMVADAVEEI